MHGMLRMDGMIYMRFLDLVLPIESISKLKPTYWYERVDM